MDGKFIRIIIYWVKIYLYVLKIKGFRLKNFILINLWVYWRYLYIYDWK